MFWRNLAHAFQVWQMKKETVTANARDVDVLRGRALAAALRGRALAAALLAAKPKDKANAEAINAWYDCCRHIAAVVCSENFSLSSFYDLCGAN